jgi:hypothetical protein
MRRFYEENQVAADARFVIRHLTGRRAGSASGCLSCSARLSRTAQDRRHAPPTRVEHRLSGRVNLLVTERGSSRRAPSAIPDHSVGMHHAFQPRTVITMIWRPGCSAVRQLVQHVREVLAVKFSCDASSAFATGRRTTNGQEAPRPWRSRR